MIIQWKPISAAVLIAAIPVGLGLNAAYKEYHTDQVVRIVEPIIIQHANEVESRIEVALRTGDETQRKVDELTRQVTSLQVSAAIAAVGALSAELDRYDRNPENSDAWRRERSRITRQIEQAKSYQACLINQQPNCDLLRGW